MEDGKCTLILTNENTQQQRKLFGYTQVYWLVATH